MNSPMNGQDKSSNNQLGDQNSYSSTWIEVHCRDRWQVFHRLQELEIPCRCRAHKPLWVNVESAYAAIQLWSVTHRTTASREELAQQLEACWRQPSQ